MEKLLFLPPLASQHGQRVDQVIIYLHVLMIALFVGWLIYFGYALWRFRAARAPKANYLGVRSHTSTYLEVLVAGIETAILVGLALPFWARAADKFPKESEATVVKVAAQQFAWNVLYPGPDGEFGRQDMKFVSAQNSFGLDATDPKTKDDIISLNEIHVPVNKPVIVYLSSKDVIHSFKVFPMRITQDAIPGLSIPIHFVPDKVGVYQINCAQLCGNGHAAMAGGRLHVDTSERYAAWIKSKSASSGTTSYE
jgi:cytochrome c oxidase subunit 2